jgi:hypothetical protein
VKTKMARLSNKTNGQATKEAESLIEGAYLASRVVSGNPVHLVFANGGQGKKHVVNSIELGVDTHIHALSETDPEKLKLLVKDVKRLNNSSKSSPKSLVILSSNQPTVLISKGLQRGDYQAFVLDQETESMQTFQDVGIFGSQAKESRVFDCLTVLGEIIKELNLVSQGTRHDTKKARQNKFRVIQRYMGMGEQLL